MSQKSIKSFFGGGGGGRGDSGDANTATPQVQDFAEAGPSQSGSRAKKMKSGPELKREFQESWRGEFKWLSENSSSEGLYCSLCINAKESNAFTKGCKDLQRSALTRHMKTNDHIRAEGMVKSRQLMHDQVRLARNENDARHTASFRTAYFLAKEDLPNAKFVPLVELQRANGCSQLQGNVYCHHQTVTEMQDCIAEVLENQALGDARNSPFVGVIIDETVNVTVNKKLIIFLRYVKDGEACTTFCGNYTVNAGDAETVFEKVRDVLHEKGIDCRNVVGLGSDGASVMFGTHNGVGARMNAICPHLVHVHCVAHRVALVASNSAKDSQKVADFRRALNNIHFYFKNSAARYDRLREMHRAFEDSDFISLKEPCSVRWLSFTKALESVYTHWQALVLVLEQDAITNPTAAGILRQIKSYWFVATMHMLLDILPITDRLNKHFQEENVNLSSIKPRVAAARERLHDHIATLGDNEELFSGNQRSYKGVNLLFAEAANIQSYETMRREFISSLVRNLDKRFPAHELDVLSALGTIFDVRMFPGRNQLQQYGNDALEVVIRKFAPPDGEEEAERGSESESGSEGEEEIPRPVAEENQAQPRVRAQPLLDADRTRRAFAEMKYSLHAVNPESFLKACKIVILDFTDFPDFVVLAKIALTIPVSSVPCERGFSTQNAIKTPSRANLADKSVDNLMRISMEGPSISNCKLDSLIQAAARNFNQRCNRRK